MSNISNNRTKIQLFYRNKQTAPARYLTELMQRFDQSLIAESCPRDEASFTFDIAAL